MAKRPYGLYYKRRRLIMKNEKSMRACNVNGSSILGVT